MVVVTGCVVVLDGATPGAGAHDQTAMLSTTTSHTVGVRDLIGPSIGVPGPSPEVFHWESN